MDLMFLFFAFSACSLLIPGPTSSDLQQSLASQCLQFEEIGNPSLQSSPMMGRIPSNLFHSSSFQVHVNPAA